MTNHHDPEERITIDIAVKDGTSTVVKKSPSLIHVTFVKPDGQEDTIEAPVGLSVLEVAHQHKIDLEGACEGSLACSTCHVIVDEAWYPKLEEALEDEEDMLDLAFGLTSTSRLGCQIILTEKLNGLRVKLPSATRNMAS